jgi:putative cell wall-binding protein
MVGRLALLVVVLLVATVPVVALAQPVVNVTMAQIHERGANGLRALELAQAGMRTAAASETISGHVALPGAWAADANVQAIGFSYDAVQAAYVPAAFSDVATDGAYSLAVGPGNWKVGFTDSQRVYADTFYDANVSTLASATTIAVTTDTPVPGVDATMVANPVYIVSGHVGFSGATNGQPVGVGVYQVDTLSTSPTYNQFIQIYSEKTDASGDYRVHLTSGGPTELGFNDFNDVFSPVFYANSPLLSGATTVSPTVDVPLTGLDVTMTVQPSGRVSGDDPYGTSIALSQSQFDAGFGGTVVLASATSPDSMPGGPYALAQNGPLLLTSASTMPDEVKTEIERLNPMQVVILGGGAAVSLDQEVELRDMGIPVVRRLYGADRYATAAQVAQELVNAELVGSQGLGIAVANGRAYADAVAGGPVAAANSLPILLVTNDFVPAATEAFITKNAPATSLVFGGTGVVSDEVKDLLPNATRLGGADRYDTAALIAAYGIDTFKMQPRVVGLGCGWNSQLYNSLAAAPILGARNQVLLLTPSTYLSPYTETFLTARAGTVARLTAVGDTANVSDETFAAAKTAAGIQ